jgi:transposase
MSGFNPTLDPKPAVVRRLEIVTGRATAMVGGRQGADRRGNADAGAMVPEVARRHDIRPQQLFGWHPTRFERVASTFGG